MNGTPLDERSIELRREILKAIEQSRRGHIGSAFSIVEILRVLYESTLRVDPKNPAERERDRFILSKGHGCLALYAVLADRGFFPREELYKFCQLDAMLGGHPDYSRIPGIEVSTGSLGHGLSVGIGMALNARLEGMDYRTFVLIGDGECNEGAIWEGALCASKHRLANLTVLIDRNGMQCYGKTSDVLELEPLADKWRSFGFAVREVDGHDISALFSALNSMPFDSRKPSALVCHTVKGKGVPFLQWNASWHHKSGISDDDISRFRKELGAAV
jgi:transketolase